MRFLLFLVFFVWVKDAFVVFWDFGGIKCGGWLTHWTGSDEQRIDQICFR